MKKIVCELCEGTEFTKENGMFVCHGCGTRYTVEEARAMMREVEGDVSVGTPPVGVPASSPNQQQIDNLLILASTAYEASNHQEAENYCNKVIELDATSYKAWFLKGKAIGWSSTIGKLRIEEAAHSFCKAIDFAPEDEREDIKDQAGEEIQKLGLAIVETRKNRYIASPITEADGFTSDMKTICEAFAVLWQHGNAVDIPQDFLHKICSTMYEAGVETFEKADADYLSKKYPELSDYTEYAKVLLTSTYVIRNSIQFNNYENDEVKLERYKKISDIALRPISTEPKARIIYKKEWSSARGGYIYTADAMAGLSKATILIQKINEAFGDENLGDIIASLEQKVEAKKAAEAKKAEEEKQARIKAYWEAHADEKAKLDAEKADLSSRKDALSAEISSVEAEIDAMKPEGVLPSEEEDSKITNQIRDLVNQRSKLGMFSSKQKKQITDEIAALNERQDSLRKKIHEEKNARWAEVYERRAPLDSKRNELSAELDKVKERIAAIEAELTKDPEA